MANTELDIILHPVVNGVEDKTVDLYPKIRKVTSDNINSEAALRGQVWTADGNGGAYWETPQTVTVDSSLSNVSENPVENKVVTNALSEKQNTIDSAHKLSSDLVDDSGNANLFVTSSEKSAWNGKQSAIDANNKLSSDLVDDTNSTNKFVTSTEKETWNGKQNALMIDSAPTSQSTNPVQSGGVYSAIEGIDNGSSVEVVDDGAVSQTIAPDKFYNFTGALTSLTITFGSSVSGRINEYKGQFVTGVSAPTVTFPNNVSWVGGSFPAIEASKTYQFSVLNNVGVIIGV